MTDTTEPRAPIPLRAKTALRGPKPHGGGGLVNSLLERPILQRTHRPDVVNDIPSFCQDLQRKSRKLIQYEGILSPGIAGLSGEDVTSDIISQALLKKDNGQAQALLLAATMQKIAIGVRQVKNTVLNKMDYNQLVGNAIFEVAQGLEQQKKGLKRMGAPDLIYDELLENRAKSTADLMYRQQLATEASRQADVNGR